MFAAAGNKPTLLKLARDIAMAGDDEPVPLLKRDIVAEITDEPDQRRAVRLLAGYFTALAGRYADLDEVIRGAAGSGDESARELWAISEEQRLIGARAWVRILADKGPLRPGLTRAQAVDVLWLYMAVDHYRRMVRERGWSPRRYETWLAATIASALLTDGSADGTGSAGRSQDHRHSNRSQ